MKYHPFDWSSQTFIPPETTLPGKDHLAVKALAVLLKHFLVPFAEQEIVRWRNDDHYRHHLSELETLPGDEVRVKPWITGEWVEEQATILRFDPAESPDATFSESLKERFAHLIHKNKKNALFGLYLTVDRPAEHWRAVFAFTLDGGLHGVKLHDLPLRQALCLAVDGEEEKIIRWLDWAYRGVEILA